MKFPYGISDYYEIITENYFYVDRTDKIHQIEKAGKYLLFLRPRRFGKSLLLSMLRNYYDIGKGNEFDRLFGTLSIGQNPSPKHNQYFILKLDFSAVSSLGNAEKIAQNLHDHINGCIELFKVHYRNYLDYNIILDSRNSLRSLHSLMAAVQQTSFKLYLLIDEYDNFANELMMMGQSINQKQYEELLYGEGFFKTIFKTIKSLTEGQGLDKVFITGVSPVVMADITSGYNIAKDIYLMPEFNDLCGFHETDIQKALHKIISECGLSADKEEEALSMMRTFYNGYTFTYSQEAGIYNPTLVLYFLEHFQDYCTYPRKMLDRNLSMDRSKIKSLSQLANGKEIILNLLNEAAPVTIAELADRFGIEDMLFAQKDWVFLASLLYYLGVVTMDGRTKKGNLILKIPNLVIRKLYVERIREILDPDFSRDDSLKAVEALYTDGDIQPICDFIAERFFKVFDNRDYRWTNELTVKTAFLSFLFNDTFYIMDSETSLKRSYADLTMIVRPDMRNYQLFDILIEFKYVSLQDIGLSGAELCNLSKEKVKTLSVVKKKIKEAKTKLENYRKTLEEVYDNILNLRVYVVLAIGFEILEWEEL